ncbi:MAG: MarR family transcriptional regulator [Actinobacteria bacterium]|nr:MarR family transcriptional regulator [Actinomycetota bacterium]
MAHQTQPRLRVLHALRLRGFADDDIVAFLAGVSEGDATELVGELAAEGLANRREGRLSGWSLTPDGRATHAKLISEEVADAGCRDAVDDGYRRFLAINETMLGCCTQWQLRTVDGTPVPNDHTDAAHDAQAIAALAAIDDAVQPACADLALALDRYAAYGPRLRAARTKVEAGDTDWFTKPLIDSYHTVWFELHEDLLVTLGIERSKEGSS